MIKTKKDKIQAIKSKFQKHKVLTIEDLFEVIGTVSKRTVHRYIKELDYVTSYTQKGKYYTLKDTAKFDAHGLWYFNDIGFSKHGTLYDTIAHFVEHSEAGMTGSELNTSSRTEVKYALLDLVEKEKLSRVKPDKVYVYLSSDPFKAQKQIKFREKIIADQTIDQATCFRVLIAAYKFIKDPPSPEQVGNYLKNQGSKISLKVVRQVFHRYGLEKKT